MANGNVMLELKYGITILGIDLLTALIDVYVFSYLYMF